MKKFIVFLCFCIAPYSFAGTVQVPVDQPTIQAAINAASDGDTVLVSPGTYVENINFNGKNIVVGSLYLTTGDTSYISSTIIDGNQNGSVVTFESGEDASTMLSGFTIRNGNFPQNSNPSVLNGGGGIHCDYSSPYFSNLIIEENQSYENGGGVRLYHSNSVLNDILIRNNTSGTAGGISMAYSNASLINVIVNGNTASWVAGGLKIEDNSDAILTNVIITGNTAGDRGGGIYCFNSDPIFVNVTLSNNSAQYGGGIFCSAAAPSFINAILWNDSPEEIYFYDSGGAGTNWVNVTINYSVVENGEPGIVTNENGTINWGAGNIDSDPLFVDAENDNFRLALGSPCIDTGTSDGAPNTDIEGTFRPQGAGYDMGAYEYYDTCNNDGICNLPENCITCPEDCIGKNTGKPSKRYCCGDEVCEGEENSTNCEVDCGPPPECVDGLCEDPENSCSCSDDCGQPPSYETSCIDGIDNDCDLDVDCNDVDDCSGDFACNCKTKGEWCSNNEECCSNDCRGKKCK